MQRFQDYWRSKNWNLNFLSLKCYCYILLNNCVTACVQACGCVLLYELTNLAHNLTHDLLTQGENRTQAYSYVQQHVRMQQQQ